MSSLNDEVLSGLVRVNRLGVTVVTCSKNGISWTGFLVSVDPWVIVTCSHPVSVYDNSDLMERDVYTVQFIDGEELAAQQVAIDRFVDLLILSCDKPKSPVTPLRFTTDLDLTGSVDVWTISHPKARYFRVAAGKTCSSVFWSGVQQLFDHSCQLFQGSSGAPLMNREGLVVGMQVGECLDKFRVVCPAAGAQLANDDINEIPKELQEICVHPCNLKQAVPSMCLETCIKYSMFNDADYQDLKLHDFLRVAVRNRISGTSTTTAASSSGTASTSGSSTKRARSS